MAMAMAMERQIIFGIIILLSLGAKDSQQISLPTDSTYNAGVVEYPPATQGTQSERSSSVFNGFMSILESNATIDLDILVFPEYVLNNKETATFIPDPILKISPCIAPDYAIFLVELSCAARSRNLYVVLNMMEKELCGNGYGSKTQQPCPPDGVQYFNTNVVLDRQGRVISRYRKTHLWRGEYYSRAVLEQPDLATFTTDFGVTFGHFICFDMLFYEPAMQLVHNLNITDIIYPTYWFSELPFLTAIQLQEGWAFANDINLLAADGSKPSGRTTGSGIYAGRAGRLTAQIVEEDGQQFLLTAQVPKRDFINELPVDVLPVFQPEAYTNRFTKLSLYRDYNVDIFTTVLLPANFTNEKHRLCHNNNNNNNSNSNSNTTMTFCCDFDVERTLIQVRGDSSVDAYRYRLAAYYGDETTLIRVDRSEQAVCALFACTDDNLYSCGRIFPAALNVINEYYFSAISINANFPSASRRLIMPSTVDAMMMPLPVAQYSWLESTNTTTTTIHMELNAPKADLLTFGIWANYYTMLPTTHNLDHLQGVSTSTSTATTTNSGQCRIVGLPLLTILIIAIVHYFK